MSEHLKGQALLDDPAGSKGTAFTADERAKYRLEGLLPHAVETLDRQVERVMGHLEAKPTDLLLSCLTTKSIFLARNAMSSE